MKATTTLIAAAVLAFATGAMAQQRDDASTRGATSAGSDTMKPADDAARTKGALHNLGEKTRNAMHRAGDKMRHAGHAAKDKTEQHARKDDRDSARHDHMHARADRHDTRAMGAGRDMRDERDARDARDAREHRHMRDGRDMRDADSTRRSRMDEAYDNWKARHNNG